jgi:iron(III) transport system substrate-binding protein
VRARTVVYAPDRVGPDEVPDSYEALADPEWDGRICLRTSADAYQQSLVASLIAEHGYDETLEIVRGWVDDAEILPNDILLLQTIAEGGKCDVGIANHYDLARLLEEDPDFPVALHWVDQDGRGVHVNISGGGVTRYADDPELAQRFLEWLATDGQAVLVHGNHEYPANPAVEPDELLASVFPVDFVRDPINAGVYGALNPEAIELMDEAGYR